MAQYYTLICLMQGIITAEHISLFPPPAFLFVKPQKHLAWQILLGCTKMPRCNKKKLSVQSRQHQHPRFTCQTFFFSCWGGSSMHIGAFGTFTRTSYSPFVTAALRHVAVKTTDVTSCNSWSYVVKRVGIAIKQTNKQTKNSRKIGIT